MASQREYEMLFRLNAQLGGSYKATFSKAQAELSRMAKEVEALKKTQSDISAYQKQQGAVEATRQKLAVLQQQYDNIQKEIKETSGFSSDLENKLLSKQQQIDKTTDALNRQTDKLSQMDSALKSASIDTSNLTGESQRLQAEMDDVRGNMEEAADQSQGFGESSVAAFGAIQTAIAAAGVAAALKEISEAYMDCVNVAGEFEATMSTVEALSGANAEELRLLSDLAKELGATTVFTAQEAAEAMTYMGMAGWKTTDMLSGMDGVLQLAAASGEDLAMVSDIVTDNLTAFGLAATDTAHFSDVLAAAATNSNTNVSIMGETFKMSASVAGALGYSVEDVAIAVGLMANSGIKGSIAGTALKNTFNGLLEGVTLTGAAFGEYEYSAIQADGTMKAFSSTIDELRGVFENMTEAERVNNAMALAGQRGYNGLLAILNATEEDYQSLTNTINNCSGAAQRMASIKLDNMMGDLELMNSAWEGVTLTVGEQFTPVMGSLYALLAKVFDGVNKFIQKHPGIVKAIAAFTAVIGTVVAAITAYSVAAKIAAAASALLSAAIPGVNIIMGITVAVAAVTAGIVALVSACDDGIPSVRELTEEAAALEKTFADSEAAYAETTTGIEATTAMAETYAERLKELEGQGLNTAESQEEYRLVVDKLNTILPELNLTIDEQTGLLNGGTAALEDQIDAWKRLALEEAMQTKYNDVMSQWAAAELEVYTNQQKLNDAVAAGAVMQDRYDSLVAEYCALGQDILDVYDDTTLSAQEQTLAIWELEDQQWALDEQIRALSSDMKTNAKEQKVLTEAVEEGSSVVSGYEEEVDEARRTLESLTGAEEDLTAGQDALMTVIGETKAQIDALTEAYNDAYDAAYSSVSGQYALWETAAEVVATSAETINTALESQAKYWQDYNTNLQSLSERGDDIEGLQEMLASFADGSADSVNAVAGMATASDEDLKSMVENWQAVQEAQAEVSGSLADVSVDLQSQMDDIVNAFKEDVDALDLGDEAAENGRATIQSYIDAASDMLPSVQAAYRQLGQAASAALGGGISYYGLSRGYASGTESAERGFAMVGENGPEIVYFNGGEQVLNAEETAALQNRFSEEYKMVTFAPALLAAMSGFGSNAVSADGGYYAPVSVSVVFQISGNASRETVEALEAYGDDFADRVIAVMEEAGVDTVRRAYR